jgi:transmembrane sensor
MESIKFGKDKQRDEENKRFFQSLSWVTIVLERYFSGRLSKEDAETVEKSLHTMNMQTIQEENQLSDKSISESHQRIKKAVLAHIQPTRQVSLRRLHFKIAAAAAVILLVGVLSFTYFSTSSRTNLYSKLFSTEEATTPLLTTGDAEMKEITLPDGTRILANANTRISYVEKQFNKNKREIWMEGEAFFDVAKNPDKPFIIYSGQLRTTVRGTSFNIKAYPEIGETGVSVRDGKVEVSDKKGRTLGLLTADKRIIYNMVSRTHHIENCNWQNDAAWHERRLAVSDANIAELKLRLKQIYGIDLTIQSGIAANTRFGLSFRRDASLTEVLDMIAELYDVKYRRASNHKIVIYN